MRCTRISLRGCVATDQPLCAVLTQTKMAAPSMVLGSPLVLIFPVSPGPAASLARDQRGHFDFSTASSFSRPRPPGTPRAFMPARVLSPSLSTTPRRVTRSPLTIM